MSDLLCVTTRDTITTLQALWSMIKEYRRKRDSGSTSKAISRLFSKLDADDSGFIERGELMGVLVWLCVFAVRDALPVLITKPRLLLLLSLLPG